MAQNLMERLKAAMSPRARVADTATLLDDLKAEQARLTIARDQASAESIDFALSEDDREEAAAKAGRLDRTIKALDAEIVRVDALLEERRSDDARKAKEAEKRAALTERDEIAARFANRVPAMIAELTGLLTEVQANERRLLAAGLHEPNAEWHARGIPGNGYLNNSPVQSFLTLKIPEFRGAGRSWPVDTHAAFAAAQAEREHRQIIQGREDREREAREKAEAAAKFAREYGTYRLSVQGMRGDGIVRIPEELVTGNVPRTVGCWEDCQRVLAHTVAEQLAKVPHLKVERLDRGGKQ
jgi:hypothetical protein